MLEEILMFCISCLAFLYFLPGHYTYPEREREREKEAVSKHFLEYCLLKKNDLIFAVFVTKKSDFTEQIFAIS